MICTVDDAFIHCHGWTTNKVRSLMGKMEQENRIYRVLMASRRILILGPFSFSKEVVLDLCFN